MRQIIEHFLREETDEILTESTVMTQEDLGKLETILDALFKTLGIDVSFTNHFLDRINDPRNRKQITFGELRAIFTELITKYSKQLQAAKNRIDLEAVLSDITTSINVPFILKWNPKRRIIDLVTKTVMRKPNFLTTNEKWKIKVNPKNIRE